MTWKKYFLVGLNSVDDGLSMHFWDQQLVQAGQTLNLLQPTIINPVLSANNMVGGPLGLNSTTMGLPGFNIIVHEKTGNRGSWAFHGVSRFYIGPFMNGYCTYKIYIPKMRAEQSENKVNFFHNQPKFPSFQQQLPSQSQSPIYSFFKET